MMLANPYSARTDDLDLRNSEASPLTRRQGRHGHGRCFRHRARYRVASRRIGRRDRHPGHRCRESQIHRGEDRSARKGALREVRCLFQSRLSEDEWDLALDVNLKSIFLLSREVIPHMIKAGSGVIINTGSGWSLKGGPQAASYCAAKAGVLNLTRAMAIDYGKHNIRVNCICPGDIDTPMLQSECEQLGEETVTFLREAANRPIARVGTPEDVANAVLFLASGMATWT